MTLGSLIILLVILGLVLPLLPGVKFDPRVSQILTVFLVVLLILWLVGVLPHQRILF